MAYNIIFMGTPDFAVPALKKLQKGKHHVNLVVTQPDREKGRGRKVFPPPVKLAALELGLDVIQPESVKTNVLADTLEGLKPDLFVVVGFGHILPKNLLRLPKLGTINIHASLLPKYRGPAPIQWTLINNEKETGVTAMLMDEGLDTGDILFRSKTKIGLDETAATLHDRLAEQGADLLIKTLRFFEDGDIRPIPQDSNQASYAPLLKKKDGHIDWRKPAEDLEAFVRGMTPWPGAFTFHADKRLIIFKAKSIPKEVIEPPGTVLKGFPDELPIATGKGGLSVLEIQGASGKRLSISNFLRGYRLPPGTVLS